jgi:flavorubredoxin
MPATTLFHTDKHENLLLEDFGHGQMVQANQHLIVHGKAAIILDPGGHRVLAKALSDLRPLLGKAELKYIFLSHQDPDIVAAINGWLMHTDATAYISALWSRFLPHLGIDGQVSDRLLSIPDEGMRLDLDGAELLLVPAHFLHSPGNFQVYDPLAKVLYTGDLGASLGTDETVVADFDRHVAFMEGFHKRYMASGKALRAWARLARTLDVEIIAPQHGAMFRGRDMVARFISWTENLACGVDLLSDAYTLPQ